MSKLGDFPDGLLVRWYDDPDYLKQTSSCMHYTVVCVAPGGDRGELWILCGKKLSKMLTARCGFRLTDDTINGKPLLYAKLDPDNLFEKFIVAIGAFNMPVRVDADHKYP